MKTILTATALVLAAFSAVPSEAATYLYSYVANSGAPAGASGKFVTANVLNAVGGYDVLGINGSVDGDFITGLVVNANQPNPINSADGRFNFDNVYYATGEKLDGPGLLFNVASGLEYNLFLESPGLYHLYSATPGGSYGANSLGTFTVTGEVPEPATWAMIVLGFGMVGAMARRRGTVVTA